MWQQLRVSLWDRYLGTQESGQLCERDKVDVYRTVSGMGGQAGSEQGASPLKREG